jgi:O-antigen/teichoic acid export membrane protein
MRRFIFVALLLFICLFTLLWVIGTLIFSMIEIANESNLPFLYGFLSLVTVIVTTIILIRRPH